MKIENARKTLLEFKEVLDEANIIFWLSCGTLLGAVRQGDFIPYEVDIDVIVLAEKWQPQIVPRLQKAGLAVPNRVQINKRGVKIDVLCYAYFPPKDLFVLPRKFRGEPRLREIPRVWLEEVAFIEFLGTKFRIPYQSEKLLTLMYGPTWRIPQDSGWKSTGAPWMLPSEFMPWFEKHPEKLLKDIKHWNFSSTIGRIS